MARSLRNSLRRRRRGAAIVEFALVIPLLVTMLMFSLFFAEIARGKLKLQEASRFAAFEMTSYTLTDYGKKDHAHAFQLAADAVTKDTEDKFKDFDSLEDSRPFNFIASFDPVSVKVEDDGEIDLFKSSVDTGVLDGIVGAVDGTLSTMVSTWGFNTHGRVKVTVSSAIHPTYLPQHYEDEGPGARFGVDHWGGQDLSALPIKNTFYLVATGWDLPDGADANASQGKAGRHSDEDGGDDSGLYTQVNRMTYFGLKSALTNIPGLGTIIDKVGFFFPAIVGTFVVDHNYKRGEVKNCNNLQHPAEPGEQNFATDKDGYPGVDWDNLRCFDTVPFRDTAAYTPGGSNDSLYEKMFLARGEHFMGCKNPQADDPTFQKDPNNTDNSNPKENCD